MKNILPNVKVNTLNQFFAKKSLSWAKGLCQNRQLEKCPKSSKNGQNRDFKPRIQDNQSTYNRNLMFITRIRQDIAIAKDVMKKYKKIAEICSKKSRKSWISSITLQQRSRDRPPGLIIFQKLFQKLPKRILITLAKNRIDCICCFFHEFFYRQGGVGTTPQMLSTVKSRDLVRILLTILYLTDQHLPPFYRLFCKIANLISI